MCQVSLRPRHRLKCPACGGAPRLPRDLRQEVGCACGVQLRLARVLARAPVPPREPPKAAQPRAVGWAPGAGQVRVTRKWLALGAPRCPVAGHGELVLERRVQVGEHSAGALEAEPHAKGA